MSKIDDINESTALQLEYPSIKKLVNRFKKTTHYKTPEISCPPKDKAVLNRLIKLLDPINSEAIKTANDLGVSRRDILLMDVANSKIASAVVAAAKAPPDGGNGSPSFEFKF